VTSLVAQGIKSASNIRFFADTAAVRARPSSEHRDRSLAFVESKKRIFFWDENSGNDEADDDAEVLKPTDLPITSVGRFRGVGAGATIASVVAGAGLTGGGSSGTVTLDVGAGAYVIANANNVAVDATTTPTADKVVARGAAGEVAGTRFVTAGNVALTGLIGFPKDNVLIAVRDSGNTADIPLLSTNTSSGSTVVGLGRDASGTNRANYCQIGGTIHVFLETSGASALLSSAALDVTGVPIKVNAIDEHTAGAGLSLDAAQFLFKDRIASIFELFLGQTPTATRNARLYMAKANVVATTATIDTITLPANTGHLIVVFGVARNAGRVYAFVKAVHASRFAGAAAVGTTVVILDQQTAGGAGWVFDFSLSSPDVRLQLNTNADTADVDLYVLLLRST
jgi:hypothetical protein